MPFVTNWNDLPEVEVLPNNFRKSAAGLKTGVNYLRFRHPMQTPLHHHDDAEQTVLMLKGRMIIQLGDERHEVGPGDICVVPIGIQHMFETIEGEDEVELYEIFAPMRVQNLVGFLGRIF